MRTPSRFLFSPRPARVTAPGGLILALLGGGLLYWIYTMVVGFIEDGEPLIFIVAAAVAWLAVASWRDSRQRKNQWRALAQQRSGQSICDFARSFDTRKVDTWVIRAVWNSLSSQINAAGPHGYSVPLSADDRLEIFALDDEEELFDTLTEIAERAGRDLQLLLQEGWSHPVVTVRDMVMLLNAQPMTEMRKSRLLIA